ncbi:aldose 1-epimerase [Streptomyces sp. NBC_01142]|uniref:aldose epimerase family protein n=1 Tax=Streptomyces sp. NBC_01142 TaxID=2975865 RepID=UPI0022534DE9|nr:aldose 1-epimerase [Streptomyces sp. NBC_01142]MCX4824652.1 aldose 1-epimerase [Streptomyces sp. NBC_01142]
MSSSEESIRLAAGDVELTVHPQIGCRIGSLRIGGTEVLHQGERYGCFPMVPWCGRVENGQFRNGAVQHQLPLNSPPHAIHGTGRDAAWRTARANKSDAAFTYDLADPWPYTGRVTQAFELTEDSLTLTMSVETYGTSFPAQAGWHPWFLRNLGSGESESSEGGQGEGGEGGSGGTGRGEDVRIDFTPEWQEQRGDGHLPTGQRIAPLPGPWDDCFGMPDGVDVTLTWPERLELKVTSRAEWVVIYDEQTEAVCVEPQSGPPNGLNTHPQLVTPIEPLEIAATWSWRRL